METLKTHYLDISGRKLAYVEQGKDSHGALILIHGNSNSKEVFKKQFSKELTARYRVIAVDLPGHGESSHDPRADTSPEVYSLGYYAETLAAFARALGVSRPLLIGHSLGGHVATHATRHCESSGLLTLQAPPLESYEDLGRAFNPIPGLAALFGEVPSEEQLENLMENFFPDGKPDPIALAGFRRTDPKCRRNVGQSLSPGTEIGEQTQIRQAKIPVAIVFAERDGLISAQYMDQLKLPNLWRGRVIRLSQCGHYPQLTHPDEFNALLSAFAADVLG